MQYNWPDLSPALQLAINNRTVASIGMSPFFIGHGYHVEPIQQKQVELTLEE
jgi:hypothetical protein